MATAKQQAVPIVQVKAEAKWVRLSARKARIVLEHIRGRTVPEARTILRFTQRHAAAEIEKILHSAVSNAEANHGLIGDELVIAAAYADEGPTLKRWRARARGRVNRIRKRTCHITVVLTESERLDEGRRRRPKSAVTESAVPEASSASSSKRSKRKEAVA